MSSHKWTALVVDDEALARRNVQLALAEHPQWHGAELCASAAEARVAMAQREFDLLLLDIQMPRQNGLSFAAELCAGAKPPLMVFVTAYDEHALAAFDVFALDYLLKPFDDLRFAAMLVRVEQVLKLKQGAAYAQAMGGFLHEQRSLAAGEACPTLDFLSVRSVGLLERIAVADIEWISAAGNYVELHLRAADGSSQKPRVVLHRATLSALEQRLPSRQFMRVHRTVLLRPEAVLSLEVSGDACYEATLRSADKVPVSERYVKQVRALFA
ncbi:LytTR family DNA-binding domain-containing protein [Paucibacter sp. B2R-40]|uniref:LytR/AlgR family response regulator transcription factor n=1 Tax=Paucibacter sp. B2R-40 TaxID=2893554 RepID=UPI0021E50F47|nr:LytTR family DNA-binding domain-containing protein [Paucibacter sp. B2R-40]MCV2357000.1 LytTR family DNA-binding domain-containing protein [Paucibacter sp. B2R-40]